MDEKEQQMVTKSAAGNMKCFLTTTRAKGHRSGRYGGLKNLGEKLMKVGEL